MATFTTTIAVDATVEVVVEADNLEEAKPTYRSGDYTFNTEDLHVDGVAQCGYNDEAVNLLEKQE
jgi:hypothetical protein